VKEQRTACPWRGDGTGYGNKGRDQHPATKEHLIRGCLRKILRTPGGDVVGPGRPEMHAWGGQRGGRGAMQRPTRLKQSPLDRAPETKPSAYSVPAFPALKGLELGASQRQSAPLGSRRGGRNTEVCRRFPGRKSALRNRLRMSRADQSGIYWGPPEIHDVEAQGIRSIRQRGTAAAGRGRRDREIARPGGSCQPRRKGGQQRKVRRARKLLIAERCFEIETQSRGKLCSRRHSRFEEILGRAPWQPLPRAAGPARKV